MEVGVHPTLRVLLDHQGRSRRVAHADDGVAPRHLIPFRAEPDTEGSVALAGAQPCRRRLDGRLGLGDGLGVDLGADGGVDQFADRLGEGS
jgi:hypothetical protein